MSNRLSRYLSSGMPFVIAEIGVNYYDIAQENNISPLEASYLMIDEATKSGADAVKFQSYKANKLASKDSPAYWDITEEPSRSQFELFSRYDGFNAEDYRMIADYCDRNNIIFLSTPFDFEAVDYLDDLCPLFKISSSDITNWPFLEYIARKNKPVILSTGASYIGEIDDAVNIILKHGSGDICLMHCVLSYPTKYEDAHLNMIKHLSKIYPDHIIGYSDHTIPDATMTCLTTAYLYGAQVIEKHFTLNKSLPGNDHYHAMSPDDLSLFRTNIKLISQIGGSENKRPLQCEEGARLNARRSIVANKDIHKGEIITLKDLTFKRPGAGISPKYINLIRGAVAKRDIAVDELLRYDSLDLNDKDV